MMRYKISGMSCVACSATDGLGLADHAKTKNAKKWLDSSLDI
ncbi:MAG: hypothetical protein PUE73_08105 [Eubacteriales bacterium]|nr:hypothetical protein [Eubacteriales bacterium]